MRTERSWFKEKRCKRKDGKMFTYQCTVMQNSLILIAPPSSDGVRYNWLSAFASLERRP